jgi:long-chain acyl-CoA synthetase
MSSPYADKPWLASYPPYVPQQLPLPKMSMIGCFEESVKRRPEQAAVYYFDHSISYQELDDMAEAFAVLLAEWGVGKGDRVAVCMQNNPQFLIAQYGAWKRGAIMVPLNPMFKEKELEYHLNDSGAKVLICLESLYAAVAKQVVAKTMVEHVVTTHEADLLPKGMKESIILLENSDKQQFAETTDMIEAVQKRLKRKAPREEVTPEDIAYLVYTSGTTGLPKGAISLHKNIAFNAEVYRTWMQLGDEDCVLGVAPLFHITGIVGHIAVAGIAGIPLVLFHRFDVKEMLRLVEKWRPTFTIGSITVYIALMNYPDAEKVDLSSLKKCYSGGAPIAPSITERFMEKFGIYIHNGYGLTESNSPTHVVPLGARAPVDLESGALSVGIPAPNCEVKLVDLADPSKEVAPGETGEFAVRGPMIFAGYWNKPNETEKAFHDGWFLTGDVVKMDEKGWFYVVDRKKDMIIASGFKVWPRDVEDVLYQHLAVKEAAVVGVPHPYRGETVRAYVSLKEGFEVTEEELIQFCKERMADYKYPREIVFLNELPKTATGKFLRRQLRDQAREEAWKQQKA